MKLKITPLLRLILAAGLLATGNLPAANTAIEPMPRAEKWMQRHEEFLQRTKQGEINVLFLGDSITDFWRRESPEGGKAVWDEKFAPLGAANFGISGDRTQQVLWRIGNGELDGIHPQVVVLMIGTNNIGFERDMATPRNSVPEAIEGVGAVLAAVRARLPDSKVLLLGIFPRGEKSEDPGRQQITEVNAAIAKLHDGKRVFFLDVGSHFVGADGTISTTVMPDYVHPNVNGYRLWANAIATPLTDLLRPGKAGS